MNNPLICFSFGYLVFESEKIAEKNYQLLMGKKFKGQNIIVDYTGSKSKNKPHKDMSPVELEANFGMYIVIQE